MKTCSKCKREQDLSCFVKSNRYKDGLYPSCKDCRKASREATLAKNPLCSKCGIKPHTSTHAYCYDCARIAMGDPPEPKFRRDVTNKTMCSKCKVKPRATGKNYCRDCSNAYNRNWIYENGGSWGVKSKEEKEKSVARHYASWLLKSGKIKRGKCAFCDQPGTEFHHFDYEPRTLNFVDICYRCHVDAHRKMRADAKTVADESKYSVDSAA